MPMAMSELRNSAWNLHHFWEQVLDQLTDLKTLKTGSKERIRKVKDRLEKLPTYHVQQAHIEWWMRLTSFGVNVKNLSHWKPKNVKFSMLLCVNRKKKKSRNPKEKSRIIIDVGCIENLKSTKYWNWQNSKTSSIGQEMHPFKIILIVTSSKIKGAHVSIIPRNIAEKENVILYRSNSLFVSEF